MNQLLKIFLTGTAISFLGSLPLGTTNVAATHIAVQDGPNAAFSFAIAAVLVEIMYARIALVAMDRVSRHQKIFKAFQWFTVAILFALAAGSLVAAIRKTGLAKAMPVHAVNPFLLGTILSATNPMHITFWFGWSVVLLDKHILLPQTSNYNVYTAGIGIGSILGYAVFILGGSYLVNQLRANQDILNWIIGITLFITALIQLYKILRKSPVSFQNTKSPYF